MGAAAGLPLGAAEAVAPALAAHTAVGAAAAGLDADVGHIAPGPLADLVVLSGPPGADIRGLQIFVGGGPCWACTG